MNRAVERKKQRIEQVVELVRGRFADERGREAGEAEAFLRRYYASVAPDDVLAATHDHLIEAALSLWRFGVERRPGEARVRVFNPTLSEHGWQSRHTVVEVVNDDMPFLVSSITAELNRRELALHLVAHPVVRVERSDRRRTRLLEAALAPPVGGSGGGSGGAGGRREAYIHVELDQETRPEVLEELAAGFAAILADVRAAVEDWPKMLDRVKRIAAELEAGAAPGPAEEVGEAVELLRWLVADHFLLLGYRAYDLVEEGGADYLRPVAEAGLGVLRRLKPESQERAATPLRPEVSAHVREPLPLFITKAYGRSTVHRAVHMDFIGVRRFDGGRVVGEHRLMGLFTSNVYDDSVRQVPVLRRKVDAVVRRAGFAPGSHDARALHHILETLPRDELFQISDDQLYDLALGVLQLQERQQLALFVRPDRFERWMSCLVYVPRERYTTELGERMKAILAESFGGEVKSVDVRVGDSPLARALYVVKTRPGRLPPYDVQQIVERLEDASRSWRDNLRQALVERCGEQEGLAHFRRYGQAFHAAYREDYSASEGVEDLLEIEALLAGQRPAGLALKLYRPAGRPAHEVNVKLYRCGAPRPLSDLLPMLENMGFTVASEVPYPVKLEGVEETIYVRDFGLVAEGETAVDVERLRQRFEDTFVRVWTGEIDNDPFNRLVNAAGLTWRQVVVLRAYYRFKRQIGLAFSQSYTARALAENPEPARLLVERFEIRFDPDLSETERRERAAQSSAAFREALSRVAVLDQDRILRRFHNLIRNTLRTNFFQRDAEGRAKGYLSLKLDSRAIKRLPLPKPLYEIFVYSPRVEAVHLRGGKVARGGVRWSDRPEDFRTEVLGLMKAQMVKNAVIIPVGAKGGFTVKRPPAAGGREALTAEGIECYKTMVRGLLDLTDNLSGDAVVPPPRVVRHDDDDPYLVVAADKGTAKFSDVANQVAAEYGFWLGDAFASGGSAGYDHKAMGITARGAWESVKRHFRELGTDVQSEDFTVVGVGDMSGDVFGNGMLLSEHVRLVAAFNHQHVFVDPDPDPAASFAERRRLFELPRSGWDDYDPAKISAGGGVFERSAKSIAVSPRMRERFAIQRPSVPPNELIKALLRAEVDLLWFGGIGTFVKASDESHTEAGDRANDDLRVDAADLGCRVVGEGANLGVTQLGRIEYALGGGRINTDAIDNSGGVDTSDHEVNIKILLGDAVAAGRIDLPRRNALLAEMTDEVARLVLRDNYLQPQAISIAEAEGPAILDLQQRMMRRLERAGRLDRRLELLPDDDEIEARRAAGRGLTRPELAVLLAYAKIALYHDLLPSDLPEDPELIHDLVLYFPEPLRERFRDEIGRHRLRREIIATHVTNSMVNRVGPTFVTRTTEDTGASAVDVARAYTIVRDAFDLRSLWSAVEALDNRVPSALQVEMILEVRRLLERATLWFLRNARDRLHVADRVAELRPGASSILAALETVLSEPERQALAERCGALEAQGVPAALARRVAAAEVLASVCDIVGLAQGSRFGVLEVARTYFALGSRFALDRLPRAAAALGRDDRWEAAAADGLIHDLFAHQGAMTRSVLAGAGDGAEAARTAWLAARGGLVARIDQLLAEIDASSRPELPMLAVLTHHLRLLVDG